MTLISQILYKSNVKKAYGGTQRDQDVGCS